MSDTFDHEQDAFERWENGERDIPEIINDDVVFDEEDEIYGRNE
jgi:hypothetical protein